MRILLIGEYSRFYNSLKEGLLKLGHEVVLIGDNDFKNYPVDIPIYAKYFKDNYLLNKFRQLVYRILKVDLALYETGLRFYLNRNKMTGFDIVQLVNEYPIHSPVFIEKKLLKFIFKNNKKVFLSSCGDDFSCVSYMLQDKFRYSVLTPCKGNPKLGHCQYTLMYVTKPFVKLHKFVYENINAVIPGEVDYLIPLEGNPKLAEMIPYPINIDLHQEIQHPITDKIIIFHGINKVNYYKKGNDYFEKALEIIQNKYGDKVEIITATSIPYIEYIELYNKSHILLDQVFSYDQGYNALEAMAKGKVVFTGAETEFMDYYNLSERVAVNALPDVDALVNELSFLIENPLEILAIAKRARAFVEKEHHYTKIASKYSKVWEAN